MKIQYDAGVDVLRILLNNTEIDESEEFAPGMIVDYDDAGVVVGIEILNASQQVVEPNIVELMMPAPERDGRAA